MAGCSFLVFFLLACCILWCAWLERKADAQQGGCRAIKFLPPKTGHYLMNHVVKTLFTGTRFRECEHHCLMTSECVSVNIGPTIHSDHKVTCELSNSDDIQHPEDLIIRPGWTYGVTENFCSILKPCLNNAKCLYGYTDKKYLCVCASGFTGENCENDADECSSGIHNCSENASCINTVGNFSCICNPGFTGDGCICSDVDECSSGIHNCSKNASCINTVGNFSCICNPGFTGDGRICLDVDECSSGINNCSKNASCVNTVGNFSCMCNPGFTGDGRICSDVDECSSGIHNCSKNASCINTVGNFSCICNPGFTGDGRICSDCNSNLRRFEEYQDLETNLPRAVEQFTIDGSQFLAFSDWWIGGLSYIYKLNNLTGKFALHQTILIRYACDFEYFMIADKHYLGVTLYLDSKFAIYQWNGTQFVNFQKVSLRSARKLRFFTILPERFLAVTTDNSLTSIYKWNDKQFEKFQDIASSDAARGVTMFEINNETFIAIANYRSSKRGNAVPSSLYKWSGNNFVKTQSLQTYGATDVKSFIISGDTFLAFANNYNGSSFIDSFIYKWNGTMFTLFQSIPTHAAWSWYAFVMCGQTYLGVANNHGKSVVYRFSGSQFIKYQEIATVHAKALTSFEYKGQTYLVVAKYTGNSAVYKWV